MKNLYKYVIIKLCNQCVVEKGESMDIKELEQKQDMLWHQYCTSEEFVSENDKEEGYPSKDYFLKQFYTVRKIIRNSKLCEA